MGKPRVDQFHVDERIPSYEWDLQTCEAYESWRKSVKAHYERNGLDFFDHEDWLNQRAFAIRTWRLSEDRKRRISGDTQILNRLRGAKELYGINGAVSITPSLRSVLRAVIELCGTTGRLYCSASSLSKRARVCYKSAFDARALLEQLGVLERVRSGGLREDGHKESNKYTVKYNVLRSLLGITNRWESRYAMHRERTFVEKILDPEKNPRFNENGCYRGRKGLRCSNQPKPRGLKAFLEEIAASNSSNSTNSAVENSENIASDQRVYTLTKLKDQKNPLYNLIDRPLLEALSRLSKNKQAQLLAETEIYLQTTPSYAPKEDMVNGFLQSIIAFA